MQRPILILGAGINGAALARECLLNDQPVVIVDRMDLASGTTAYSSRLIHGGLRYLEFGEFALVRESLEERERFLDLAPEHVRRLRFHIPVETRFGGFRQALSRFLLGRAGRQEPRGVWLVRAGLALYDLLTRTQRDHRSRCRRASEEQYPRVDPQRFHWICSYSDAQITFPERCVVAMLRDAAEVAAERDVEFRLFNYASARIEGSRVTIERGGELLHEFAPSLVVNATGAWVDATLQALSVETTRLMGGTKGSHIFLHHDSLREALGGNAVYVEAGDGRPVFLLPFLDGTLVGTTDLPFEGDPSLAVATDEEIAYLLRAVNSTIPSVDVARDHITLHYAGVRPLPFRDRSAPTSSITRQHSLVEHSSSPIPTISIIGGKLTTCRSLAEEVFTVIANRLGVAAKPVTRDRPLPGVAPGDNSTTLGAHVGIEESTCRDAAPLAIDCSDIPKLLATARWSIRHEWARRIDDLVERRLMLLYDQGLSVRVLRELAQLLVEEGILDSEQRETEVARYRDRLSSHFGRSVE